jgi:hypothetical protein
LFFVKLNFFLKITHCAGFSIVHQFDARGARACCTLWPNQAQMTAAAVPAAVHRLAALGFDFGLQIGGENFERMQIGNFRIRNGEIGPFNQNFLLFAFRQAAALQAGSVRFRPIQITLDQIF